MAVEHHPAHLASAAYVSPFDDAAVCAIDGFGDFVSTSWGVVEGNRVDVGGAVYFPHSLGLMYLAITQHLGFMKYGDEFKVMGLAPYGEPRFKNEMRAAGSRAASDGRFELDLSYFSHWSDGVDMTWDDGEPTIGRVFTPKLEALLGAGAPAGGTGRCASRSDRGVAAVGVRRRGDDAACRTCAAPLARHDCASPAAAR